MTDFQSMYEKCEKIEGKEEKIACLLKVLHEITKLQDIVNITTFKTLNEDSDSRWLPLHMIDNANAIILNISENGANPKKFDDLYVGEKINALNDKWFIVKMRGFK